MEDCNIFVSYAHEDRARVQTLVKALAVFATRIASFIAACLLAATLTGPAAADDFKDCELTSGEPAIAACSRAMATGRYKGSELAQLHNNRGVEMANKGDRAAALADYSRAIVLYPTYVNALNNRGKLKRDSGDPDGALADLNEAIRIEPTSAMALNNRANARRDKLDIAGAIADYNAAIRHDPQRALYYTNRGLAHEQAGDKTRARADYTMAVSVNDTSGDSTQWAKDTARERLAKMGN